MILGRMTPKNTEKYWKLLKLLKEDKKDDLESAIELDEWFGYFNSLNKVSEKYKNRIAMIDEFG